MKQGSYLSTADTFTLEAVAEQTGTHTLRAVVGQRVVQQTFSATATQAFQIPNVLPEVGLYEIRILQPDATEFDDGSGCPMFVETLLNCG